MSADDICSVPLYFGIKIGPVAGLVGDCSNLRCMASSTSTHIGNLLLGSHRLFRQELITRAHAQGFTDLRTTHLHVFANIERGGSRLTTLAAGAGVGPSAMLEIVDDLERLGLVHRVRDTSDRRAKLVQLTEAGRAAMRVTRTIIDEMERDGAKLVGAQRYETMVEALVLLQREERWPQDRPQS